MPTDERKGYRRADDALLDAKRAKIDEAWQNSHDALLRLDAHERECSQRYNALRETVGDMKRMLAWAVTALLSGMGAVIVSLIVFKG